MDGFSAKKGQTKSRLTTIPQIIDRLEIKGCVITIDAMGTQTKITDKITANGGDYILAVKGNQSGLEEEVEATCGSNCSVSDKTKVDKGHGQIETHRCEVFDKGLIADKEKRWVGLKTIVKITATHETGEKTETSTRLYISSLDT